jgi:hypothetical protein
MVWLAKLSNLGLKSSIRGTIQKCNAAHAIPKTKPMTKNAHALMRRTELINLDKEEN